MKVVYLIANWWDEFAHALYRKLMRWKSAHARRHAKASRLVFFRVLRQWLSHVPISQHSCLSACLYTRWNRLTIPHNDRAGQLINLATRERKCSISKKAIEFLCETHTVLLSTYYFGSSKIVSPSWTFVTHVRRRRHRWHPHGWDTDTEISENYIVSLEMYTTLLWRGGRQAYTYLLNQRFSKWACDAWKQIAKTQCDSCLLYCQRVSNNWAQGWRTLVQAALP